MTTALTIAGVICLAIGATFFWLNNNTPVQTRVPALMLPLGAVALLLALGGRVL